MEVIRNIRVTTAVALRKESVDRNITSRQLPTPEPPSLSARRAWIEMPRQPSAPSTSSVALRKESVDRNTDAEQAIYEQLRRSPQGERG